MSVDEQGLRAWLTSRENEQLEFKAARGGYERDEAVAYIVALSNEGGGHLVLGVTDEIPREVVGTRAFEGGSLDALKKLCFDKLQIRIDVTQFELPEGRVLAITAPPRPRGVPRHLDGRYLMRVGESLVPMTPDRLQEIFAEGRTPWLQEPCCEMVSGTEALGLVDAPEFFRLSQAPFPVREHEVLERLVTAKVLVRAGSRFQVTRLGALVLGRRLSDFPDEVRRKAVRVIVYEGTSKLLTRSERTFDAGYAVAFEQILALLVAAAPLNRVLEQAIRREEPMFPDQATRELLANAMIHQDLQASGQHVLVEMYSDRLTFSNPGQPRIPVARFIDFNLSRNEDLAELMRQLNICEEKGSGVDKVVFASELSQLPAPTFEEYDLHTVATLFAHRDFPAMNREDRIRACYQHCALRYVMNDRMTNQSLRSRFGLADSATPTVSNVISATRNAGLIASDGAEKASTRYARYVPFWASPSR